MPMVLEREPRKQTKGENSGVQSGGGEKNHIKKEETEQERRRSSTRDSGT